MPAELRAELLGEAIPAGRHLAVERHCFIVVLHRSEGGDLAQDRVGLVLDRLPPGARRLAETMALGTALAFVACLLWASARFVYQSWQFDEVAQGLIRIPIWIPQISLVLGAAIFFVAVLDDFIVLARGGTPAYRRAEDTQRAQPGAPLPE